MLDSISFFFVLLFVTLKTSFHSNLFVDFASSLLLGCSEAANCRLQRSIAMPESELAGHCQFLMPFKLKNCLATRSIHHVLYVQLMPHASCAGSYLCVRARLSPCCQLLLRFCLSSLYCCLLACSAHFCHRRFFWHVTRFNNSAPGQQTSQSWRHGNGQQGKLSAMHWTKWVYSAGVHIAANYKKIFRVFALLPEVISL